ncbi:MAG TPA: hypothetical protein PKY64_08740 [Anaerolineaceae bacterium]|nr:hypothetical protein [Anaerolineaceae bacterium]
MTPPKSGFFMKLLRFSFLLAGLIGFLRLYGAITQQPEILNFSQKAWLPAYLLVAGGLMGLVNFTIWMMLTRKPYARPWLPWAGVLINIIAYWLERLLLWAPSQRGTNTIWMIGVHAAWILLVVFSQLQTKRRHYEHK